jgi:hypothetical protein
MKSKKPDFDEKPTPFAAKLIIGLFMITLGALWVLALEGAYNGWK